LVVGGGNPGGFVFVARKRQQSARDVELPVRQRERIHGGRIENRDLVADVGTLGRRHQPVNDLRDHRLETRVLVGAAIRGEDALVFALVRRQRLCLLRHLRQRHRPIAVHVAGAAGQKKHERNRHRAP
jgi:hypothetical protein